MKYLSTTAYGTLLLAIYAAIITNANATERPPNIVLIMADDLGFETIAANGGESYQTPHLDRLAANGVRFEHCYSQPICTPSRLKIMTGKSNVKNYKKFGLLPRSERTFAHVLSEAGYATCITGKWQLGKEVDSPQHFGYQQSLLWQHTRTGRLMQDGTRYDKRYENPLLERNGEELAYTGGEYGPELMVDYICDFIEQNKQRPFVVYYPMILTHCPFVPTPDSDDWDPKSIGSPTYKGDAKYFGDMVGTMDRLVGRIADHLEDQGLAENTILLFTGDNGTDRPVVSKLNGRMVAGAKGTMVDAGTHVPLIVSGPGQVNPAVVNDIVDFSDFLPTMCDIACIDAPTDIDGRSFLPQLRGEKGNPRESIYCWYSRNGDRKKSRAFARNQQYKLYRSGKFFDVPSDPDEKSPMEADSLTAEQLKVKQKLQAVIDEFQPFE